MSKLSDFLSPGSGGAGSSGIFQLKAGPNGVNQGDLIEIGPDGLGYTASVMDYAAIPNASSQIVAQTTVVSGSPQGSASQPRAAPIIKNPDGSFIVAGTQSGQTGIAVYKYSATGQLLATTAVNSANGCYSFQLLPLSNGNIALTYGIYTGSYSTAFAILTTSLSVVVAQTIVDSNVNPPIVASGALTGGGFALLYSASTGFLRLAIYSNTGVATLAPTSLIATNLTYTTLSVTPLSNGNFVVGYNRSDTGGFYAIYSAAGAVISGPTAFASMAFPIALPGYFCLRGSAGAAVFDVNGVQQGSTFAGVGGVPFTDGSQNFWFASFTPTSMNLWKVPITGTNGVNYTLPLSGLNAGSNTLACAYDNGKAIFVSGSTGASVTCYVWAVDLANPTALLLTPTAFGTSASGQGSNYPNIVPGGDFSFIAYYDFYSPASLQFYIGKYANASVVGVAQNTAAQGALINVQQGVGTYPINAIQGASLVKTWDHTTGSNIYGNKGVMLKNGVVLKGM